jgi:hypothetical protein
VETLRIDEKQPSPSAVSKKTDGAQVIVFNPTTPVVRQGRSQFDTLVLDRMLKNQAPRV